MPAASAASTFERRMIAPPESKRSRIAVCPRVREPEIKPISAPWRPVTTEAAK